MRTEGKGLRNVRFAPPCTAKRVADPLCPRCELRAGGFRHRTAGGRVRGLKIGARSEGKARGKDGCPKPEDASGSGESCGTEKNRKLEEDREQGKGHGPRENRGTGVGRKSKESRGTGKNRKLEEDREPGEGHRPRENRGTGGRKRGYELYPIIKELFSRGRERPRLYDDRRRRGGV